eukprot:GHVL01033045.1.p1 GENE.GHVL01033045.1~~GHVL01033045.1.p1  ORF type:complete len:477 (+),score=58.14 GHVL01033045.1:90-1520(+)
MIIMKSTRTFKVDHSCSKIWWLLCLMISMSSSSNGIKKTIRVVSNARYGISTTNDEALLYFLKLSAESPNPDFNVPVFIFNGNLLDIQYTPYNITERSPRDILWSDRLSTLRTSLLKLAKKVEVVIILGFLESGLQPLTVKEWLNVKEGDVHLKVLNDFIMQNNILIHSGSHLSIFLREDPAGRRPWGYYLSRLLAYRNETDLTPWDITEQVFKNADMDALTKDKTRSLLKDSLNLAFDKMIEEESIVIDGHWAITITFTGEFTYPSDIDPAVTFKEILDEYSNIIDIWRDSIGSTRKFNSLLPVHITKDQFPEAQLAIVGFPIKINLRKDSTPFLVSVGGWNREKNLEMIDVIVGYMGTNSLALASKYLIAEANVLKYLSIDSNVHKFDWLPIKISRLFFLQSTSILSIISTWHIPQGGVKKGIIAATTILAMMFIFGAAIIAACRNAARESPVVIPLMDEHHSLNESGTSSSVR